MNAAPIGSPDSPDSVAPIGPFFGFLICRDPAGTDWLGRLLAATPRGRTTLGEMVDSPGQLPNRALPGEGHGVAAPLDGPASDATPGVKQRQGRGVATVTWACSRRLRE
jgi:hypothetical protein